MTDTTDTQAVIDVARASGTPHRLELGGYYVFNTPDGVEEVDLTGDEHREHPRRKTGTVVLGDVPSFLHYVGRHGDDNSEFFADFDQSNVKCVLNAHRADGDAGWQDHKAIMQLKHHPVWNAWRVGDGKYLGQVEFAEFLDEMRQWIAAPDAATVLEIVQTFHATTKVEFRSATVVKSGQRQLSWVENTNARAGDKGQLDVPDSIELGLPVYRGVSTVERVTARLRFRINDGRLMLSYKLDQPDVVAEGAFQAQVDAIREGLSNSPILQETVMRVGATTIGVGAR